MPTISRFGSDMLTILSVYAQAVDRVRFNVTPRDPGVTVSCPQPARRSPVSTVDHIEALKAKHASLEQSINQESLRPHPDDDAICSLKKRKLQIKDEIVRLTSSSTTH